MSLRREPRFCEIVPSATRISQPHRGGIVTAGYRRFRATAATLLAVVSITLGGVAAVHAQAATSVEIPVEDMGNDGGVIKLNKDDGDNIDGSTSFTGTTDVTTPSWTVNNADGTSISELNYTHKNGSTNPEKIFTCGKGCREINQTAYREQQCRPDHLGDLVLYDVTYYVYFSGDQIRRISHAVPTEEPCTEANYRLSAAKALVFGENWPPRKDDGGGGGGGDEKTCNSPLKVKPILLVKDGTSAIWEDETGKTYVVDYKPDGTTTGFPGTAPPKPSPDDIGKWQIPPDVQKRVESIKDTVKQLEDLLANPDHAQGILKKACDTPPAMAVPAPGKPATAEQKPTTEEKKVEDKKVEEKKVEKNPRNDSPRQSSSEKKPKKQLTTSTDEGKSARTAARQEPEHTSGASALPIAIDIGMGMALGGAFGGHHGGSFDDHRAGGGFGEHRGGSFMGRD